MKKINKYLTLPIILIFFSTNVFAQDTIPSFINIQLKQLQETWNVLDQVSSKVWPGWSNYSTVPFLLKYPNGLQMLVGHPNPPEIYKSINNLMIENKKVYFNIQNIITTIMTLPMTGGGGPMPIGYSLGKPVATVNISLVSLSADSLKKNKFNITENLLLVYLHELFHCFQESIYKWRFGNLRINSDLNFALYAELEGIALENAYFEKDSVLSKEFIKDFLVARELKRRGLTDLEKSQESEDEIMEGGATYAEIKALQLLKEGYKPKISSQDDPYFSCFNQVDTLMKQMLSMIKSARKKTMDVRNKVYSFGAFQALLMDRFIPNWKSDFYQKGKMFDQVLREYIKLTPGEEETIAERLKAKYNFQEIYSYHAKLIKERDDAYRMIRNRKGFSYVVNFKRMNSYLQATTDSEKYTLGVINIFPKGIKSIKIGDIEFIGHNSPFVIDQLYYVKWIDTSSEPNRYELTYSKKEENDIYYDAIFTTSGFVLKAPKIQLIKRPNRIKIDVLLKMKES